MAAPHRPMPHRSVRVDRLAVAALLAVIALFAATLWRPPYPREQWLQHAATVPLLIALAIDLRRGALSRLGFVCVAAFVSLHVIGARWLYSMVPYDAWLDAIGLPSTREAFGWTRNHYDRLVHLSFGLLLMRPLADLVSRSQPTLTRRATTVAALVLVTCCGAAYEIFEWLLAVVMSPDAAERYNGQQGDFFDAQKDLTLAAVGSVIAIPWAARRR